MVQNMGNYVLDVCYLEQIKYLLHILDERGMKAFDFFRSKELWRLQEIPLTSVEPDPRHVVIDCQGNDSKVARCATMANRHEGHPILVKIGGLSRFKFN